MPENDPLESFDWSLTTWEGSRREQLRQWAKLSVEEIVRAQEEMAELNQRFADMRRNTGSVPAAPGEAPSASTPSGQDRSGANRDEDI